MAWIGTKLGVYRALSRSGQAPTLKGRQGQPVVRVRIEVRIEDRANC